MAAEDEQGSARGPIFIVGAMGSGTTLLRLILDSHENIAIPQETGIMRAVTAQKWIPFWMFGGRWYSRLDLTEEDLNEQLRDFYNGLFQRFAAGHGKQRWGEKTPWHVWHIEEITKIWPDAVFIGIVRHPGGNAASLQNRFKFALPRALYHWRRYNLELTRQASTLEQRLMLCRYEDLVLRPEPVMRELLEWLGEPWSSRVLEHHVVHRDRGTPTKVEGRTRSDDPIDVARVNKWAEGMAAADRHLVTRETKGLAAFFGYSTVEPGQLDTIVPADSSWQWLLTGSQLADRQAAHADLADFRSPPRVPLAERPLRPRELDVRSVAALAALEGKKPPALVGAYRGVRRMIARYLPESVKARLRQLKA